MIFVKVGQSKVSLAQAGDYPAGGRHLVTHMGEVQQLLTGTAPSPAQLTAMRAVVRQHTHTSLHLDLVTDN